MRLRVPEGKEYLIHGRLYKAGDEFDAPTDREAKLWTATGLAEEIPFKRGPGRPSKSATVEAKEPPKVETEAGHYSRRDMRAEDE